ncbi:MAG: hypothetical protein JW751_00820, partial [Polyangiaceae bacterium]|nr:hypothetical protein [Polyangiaceae bacterium]
GGVSGGGTGGISGGGTGGGGTGTCSDVTITASDTQSTAIATVHTVNWSVNVPITAAHIDFGRNASDWEYTAPVPSPSQNNNATMLLGMKENTNYSYQVVVEREGGGTCSGEVKTLKTGYKISGLPTLSVSGSGPVEGFTVACVFGMGMFGGGGGAQVFILDKDAEYVWAYKSSQAAVDCVRATMSYDGQYMWVANGNVPGPSNGNLIRVKMDGTGEQAMQGMSVRHHDVAVLPNEHVVYMEYKDGNSNGCDLIKELNPEGGSTNTLLDVNTANPSFSGQCHSNAINWWPDQNKYTLSVLNWNSIIAFDQQGSVLWKFGGSITDFQNASWSHQHQHHLLSDSSILLFNNDGLTSGQGSSVLEFTMSGSSATRVWDFASGNTTNSMGDVKRLHNGNTLVTYSNNGVILEVNNSKQTVRSITAGGGTGFGYSQRRLTLYGPPPPYQD